MSAIELLVLLAYTSLVLEMLLLAIPSEASTYQLLFRAGESTRQSDALSDARQQTVTRKLLLFFLPTALGVLLFLIPLAAIPYPQLLDLLWPLQLFQTAGHAWLGAGLIILGRVVTFTSAVQLRRYAARNLQPRGLFALSRNPGLVGMYVFYLGLCFVFPCVVMFLGAAPYILNMHGRVRMEESHLARTLGDDYERYLRSVPRYLFFR